MLSCLFEVSNMATDLANGTIPSFYRDVYDLCSVADTVSKEMFTRLLVKSGLPQQKLSQIWELMEAKQGYLSRTSLYKALALVAWAQQGKELSVKLLDNFSGDEFPIPVLGDLSDLRQLQKQRQRQCHPGHLGMRYGDLCRLDTVTVHLVPEKKGIFLKHVEYQVTSKRFGTKVRRRYNDFVSLYDLLLGRFPYRLIPRLPPKKMNIGSDAPFIEERRQWLWRWLSLISRHPVINQDPILQFFFTYDGDDVQHKIREIFRRVPDEFTTSELASQSKELVPPDTLTELANSREQIRLITNSVSRVKQITDGLANRSQAYGNDMAELGTQLTILASESHGTSSWATGGNQIWAEMKKGFHIISKELGIMSSKALAQSVREEAELCAQLNSLLDILLAYRDLCARHEKGVMQDHQKAHAKMLSLKKRQMQGVLRGEVDAVVALEDRMLQQESVIASVELRSAYSLHCMHMETQLVHAHLELFATVISVLVSVQIRGHSELAEVWKAIQPTISKCLPEEPEH